MTPQELEILNHAPVLFCVRNRKGEYVWANTAVSDMAGKDVVGLTDDDLPWAEHKKDFCEQDRYVFETGSTHYVFEYDVRDRDTGDFVPTNYCKWLEEFEGEECVYALAIPIFETTG